MILETEVERIARAILEDCRTDILGLWVVLGEVRDAFPSITNTEARRVSLAVVQRSLTLGVEVGSFIVGGDFQLWKLDQPSALRRIEEQWSDSDRQLNLDDNVWLSGPDLAYRTVR